MELRTERTLLRTWRPSDRAPFAVINADPRVVEFLPAALTRAESDAFAERIETHFEQHGFGLWALEITDGSGDRCPFAGFVGLAVPRFEAAFTPCVEIGWRLDPAVWGRGYATEAACAALRHAFDALALDEVVSITVPANLRSRAVMERLGMTHDPADDFDHPRIEVGHPLRRQVLYRITSAAAPR